MTTYILRHAGHPPFVNRQPWPLHADTADFRDYADRITLARLGIFSIDSARHRAKRAAEDAYSGMIDAAYEALGLNRRVEHAKIAAAMETVNTSGIWARSTGEYSRRCRELDSAVAERVYTGAY